MSVTFFAVKKVGEEWRPLWVCTRDDCEGFCIDCEKHNINVSSANARALIEWLELEEFNEDDLLGEVSASELVARCQRRLWDEPRNHDPALPGVESGGPGTGQCKSVYGGRDEGYLRRRTEDLKFIAKCAGGHYVCWS